VPEHITDYVAAISGGEPFLIKDYLCYNSKGVLIFIGYPLKGAFVEGEIKDALDKAIEQARPEQVALIAPAIPQLKYECSKGKADSYYRLDLSNIHIGQKLRNMIKHASRELHCEKRRTLGDEHKQLISEFLNSRKVDEDTQRLFERIPEYVSSVPTAVVFEARDKNGRLIAFDIAEFGAKEYAFYMFNFRSQKDYIAGASDLLLHELIKAAQKEGKSFVNLGLGINEGIVFFKKKWGGAPFLDYKPCNYNLSNSKIHAFFKFLKVRL
jgi:hypothetical protein